MKTFLIILTAYFPTFFIYGQAFDSVAFMEPFLDLELTQPQRDSLRDGLYANQERIQAIHSYGLTNDTPPALVFQPMFFTNEDFGEQQPVSWDFPDEVTLPDAKNDLAFYTVEQLSVLIRSKKITSLELTNFYIDRIRRFSDTLECLVTLTTERALQQARKADEEMARGISRGPLHGIPYGLKDLFAVEGTVTSWGAMPFKDQEINETATVVRKLDEAGAVLVAKLTLGALAMGDVWYGGVTRNPWNLEQGSSGSSAGSASAVAAGLIPFAIGTETLGSIVSPSTRCGTTGLRPTFGRVSRYGGMALSWSMDKVGPIARSAKDCAMVFDAIRGEDQLDPTVESAPFNYNSTVDVKNLRVGFLKGGQTSANDSITLLTLREMGIQPEEVELPGEIPIYPLTIILASEASAAFDELTRSQKDTMMVRQDKGGMAELFSHLTVHTRGGLCECKPDQNPAHQGNE